MQDSDFFATQIDISEILRTFLLIGNFLQGVTDFVDNRIMDTSVSERKSTVLIKQDHHFGGE